MALCAYPELLNDSRFPEDVKHRVRRILGDCKGASVGSYTDSAGLEIVRKDVAEFIKQRDGGLSANPSDIFLTAGASDGIKVSLLH